MAVGAAQPAEHADFKYPSAALRQILDGVFAAQGEAAEALDELLRMALDSFGDVRFHAYQAFPYRVSGQAVR